nr:ZIP family metal transporter [Methanomassiliicoccus luminyensis]
MIDLYGLDPIVLALLASLFTWGMTALGAAAVFLVRDMNRRKLDIMLGFAAGVMIAASFWSLLLPALEMTGAEGFQACVPVVIGFLAGGFTLYGLNRALPHMHIGDGEPRVEGPRSHLRRTTLLVIAITMHNVPEGLAVGVAFGAIVSGDGMGAAIALAMGIGIQNFPEGFAVSAPLHGEGCSKLKSFWYGQLSGMVEPIAAVAGAVLVIAAQPILPYALAFAAGAMIFVVGEEVIPESRLHGSSDLPTISLLIGFVIMMMLDVTFS